MLNDDEINGAENANANENDTLTDDVEISDENANESKEDISASSESDVKGEAENISDKGITTDNADVKAEDVKVKKKINKGILGVIVVIAVIVVGLFIYKSVNGCIIHNWQEATCTEPKTCSKCGRTEGAALGHKYVDATCTTPKTCSVCGRKEGEPLGHTPGEWVVDEASTCTKEGTKHTECLVCGETITESIPLLQHKPGEWKISKQATVSEKGEKQQCCTVCGTVLDTAEYELSSAEKMNIYKQQCQSYSYEEIARNPDAYDGKYAVFTGEVVQSMESGNSYTLRVNVTKGSYGIWKDTIYVNYYIKDSTEPRILEDDVITMYGVLQGKKTYETVWGNSVTIPLFKAEYVSIN